MELQFMGVGAGLEAEGFFGIYAGRGMGPLGIARNNPFSGC